MQGRITIRKKWRATAVAKSATVAAGMLLACLAAAAPALVAQVSRYDEKQMGPTNDQPPALLNGVGISQPILRQAPGDLRAGLLSLPNALL
jgi:hypothetical protein